MSKIHLLQKTLNSYDMNQDVIATSKNPLLARTYSFFSVYEKV